MQTEYKNIDRQIAYLQASDPTVKASLDMHMLQGIPLEYALKIAVVSLAQQNTNLREQLTETLMWSCKPIKLY